MNVAIVGTGYISHLHAKQIIAGGHKVALVSSSKLESAKLFAAEYGCFSFCEQITAHSLNGIDAIHICTPPQSHYPLVCLAARQNVNIFCEKPLCFSLSEAKELFDVISTSKSVFAINFNNRFYEKILEIKKNISQNKLGELYLITASYLQEFHIMPCEYSWRYTAPMRATGEIGSHMVDLMRFVTGQEVACVSALFKNTCPKRTLQDGIMTKGGTLQISNEDFAIVHMKFSTGLLCSLVYSEISHGNVNNIRFEITAENGNIIWSSQQQNQLKTATKGAGTTSAINPFGGSFEDTFCKSIAAFYTEIKTGKKDDATADIFSAVQNVKICAAIAKSAQNDGVFVQIEGVEL